MNINKTGNSRAVYIPVPMSRHSFRLTYNKHRCTGLGVYVYYVDLWALLVTAPSANGVGGWRGWIQERDQRGPREVNMTQTTQP